jgi:NAD(P)-dependent dehydrogenase (short-subunit alcohol dehydrogenase family)
MLALELGPNVAVNGVAPGAILPPPGQSEAYLAKLAHANPLNRIGGPEDIAEAVLFLVHSRFITGQVIYVDGGMHMKGRIYD